MGINGIIVDPFGLIGREGFRWVNVPPVILAGGTGGGARAGTEPFIIGTAAAVAIAPAESSGKTGATIAATIGVLPLGTTLTMGLTIEHIVVMSVVGTFIMLQCGELVTNDGGC